MRFKKEKQRIDYHIYSQQTTGSKLSCLMQLLLLYLAIFATVSCVSTSLAMSVSIVWVALVCLVTTVLFAGLLFNKITTLVSLGVSAVLVAVFWSPLCAFFDKLVQAVRFCYDLAFVIMKMNGWNYTKRMLTSEEHIAELMEDTALINGYFWTVIITLAVFYSFWYVALAWKKPRIWPTFIVSLAVMVPGFLIGLVPAPVTFCLLLASAFGLYMQTLPAKHIRTQSTRRGFLQLFKKQSNDERFFYTVRSGLYGIATATISFVFMLIIALITFRTPLIELEQVRTYLDDGSRYVYNQVFYSRLETPDSAIGNLVEGEHLSVLSIPEYHDVPVYYLTTKHNETLYLRAWVTDDYDKENGWKLLNEQDDKEFKSSVVKGTDPYSFIYQLMNVFESERLSGEAQQNFGFVTDTITLRARFKKSLVAHLPAYGAPQRTEPLSSATFLSGEVALFEGERPKENTYEVSALIPIVTSKGYVGALHGLSKKYSTLLGLDTSDIDSKAFHEFMKKERSYYNYVRQKYTDTSFVPKEFKDLAKKTAEPYGSQLTRVLSIEEYFRNSANFRYTIRPKLLENAGVMEQVKYSLLTEKEGYCTYYATAMTMMVRSLGYPARYVNGYYVRPTDKEAKDEGYKRTVTDYECHAWVEVYFDGLGWMTFDPTPDTDETVQEFTDRYYALQMERELKQAQKEAQLNAQETPGDEGVTDEESVMDNALNEMADVVDLELQPDDPSVMPKPTFEYGIFGGAKGKILLIVVIAIAALLVLLGCFAVYMQAQRHARLRYESIGDDLPDGETPTNAVMVQRMNVLMLKWLALYKLERMPAESLEEYAKRIDVTLQLQRSMEEVLSIIRIGEFSLHDVPDEQVWNVRLLYDEIYRKTHFGKGKIPWYKKIRI